MTPVFTVPGVFMAVADQGVLIAGEAAIGKSELALELLSRGHRLVADDAPEFTRLGPMELWGRSPHGLGRFLAVRGLGILNVGYLFGVGAVQEEARLDLVLTLCRGFSPTAAASLRPDYRFRVYDGVEVPEVRIPVMPGRNLAVLVETAVRNHVLRRNGYDPVTDFIRRQAALLG